MVVVWHADWHICYSFTMYYKGHSCYQYLDVNKNGWTCRKLQCPYVMTQGTNRHT